jgi:hypothetical protein
MVSIEKVVTVPYIAAEGAQYCRAVQEIESLDVPMIEVKGEAAE